MDHTESSVTTTVEPPTLPSSHALLSLGKPKLIQLLHKFNDYAQSLKQPTQVDQLIGDLPLPLVTAVESYMDTTAKHKGVASALSTSTLKYTHEAGFIAQVENGECDYQPDLLSPLLVETVAETFETVAKLLSFVVKAKAFASLYAHMEKDNLTAATDAVSALGGMLKNGREYSAEAVAKCKALVGLLNEAGATLQHHEQWALEEFNAIQKTTHPVGLFESKYSSKSPSSAAKSPMTTTPFTDEPFLQVTNPTTLFYMHQYMLAKKWSAPPRNPMGCAFRVSSNTPGESKFGAVTSWKGALVALAGTIPESHLKKLKDRDMRLDPYEDKEFKAYVEGNKGELDSKLQGYTLVKSWNHPPVVAWLCGEALKRFEDAKSASGKKRARVESEAEE